MSEMLRCMTSWRRLSEWLAYRRRLAALLREHNAGGYQASPAAYERMRAEAHILAVRLDEDEAR